MGGYLLKRTAQSLVAIFGVTTLIFFIQRLTGDPTILLLPEGATAEDAHNLREALGFNRPLIVQYLAFLADIGRFDLGRSVIQNLPVTEIIASRLPYTLLLSLGALVVACGIGIPIGIGLALRQGKADAKLMMTAVLTAQSMPTFWSGILLILGFGVWLGWVPPSGSDGLISLILPSITLGLLSMATFARVTRTAVLDEMSKDYIRSARSRGASLPWLVRRHLLRNAAIPVITVTAMELSNLLAGAVIVETVFAWPGLGLLTIQAITARDFMVVQGVVLLGAFVTILLSLIADILYSVVDPRIRLEAGK
jgi:peptide/nickel transport system permease protein